MSATHLLLAAALAGAATPAAAGPAGPPLRAAGRPASTTRYVAMGRIVRLTGDRLVLAHSKKGRAVEETFRLTPATRRSGTIQAGGKATVQYIESEGARVATSIRGWTAAKPSRRGNRG